MLTHDSLGQSDHTTLVHMDCRSLDLSDLSASPPAPILRASDLMITIGCLFGLITALAGPWLWSNWELWEILTMVAFLISYIFYRVALVAADQFGELVCSSFDLFHLDLLTALRQQDPEISRPHNGTLTVPLERQMWRQLNRLLNFGDSN